jgi:hypothetical protein
MIFSILAFNFSPLKTFNKAWINKFFLDGKFNDIFCFF